MEKEPHLGKLQEVMASTVKTLVEKSAELATLVKEELTDNNPPSLPEVIAALGMIRELAGAGKTILAEGGVIFKERIVPQEVRLEERRGSTFAELLKVRIDEALPFGKKDFRKKEVVKFLRNKSGTRKAMASLGLTGQREFTREQMIEIAERTLAPSEKVGKEVYSRSRIHGSLHINLEQLAEWCRLIGHDWGVRSKFNRSETLAIRGLGALERLTKPKSSKS